MIKLILINSLLILLIVIKLSSQLNILLCTIAKEENKYIKEFIEHYKKLEFKNIVIYDNNDIKGENFKDILENELENNFVKIINYRGFEHAQKEALNDCYKRFNKEYHWIAFFDVDEFLQIINFTNINDFMALPRFKNCESILINWKYYGDNNKLYYEPKPLYERFTKPFYFNESIKPNIFLYSAAKTIVKGGLNITWALLPHFLKNTINCRPDGNILSNYSIGASYIVFLIFNLIQN